MAEIKETIPFSFDDIYQGLVEKFEAKGYDAPYEGSNLAQLITAMAYTTSMLNANTAANVNETLLTLANKRDNILKDARLLGYEISHKTSYRYNIEIEFPEGSYSIPKYQEFTQGDYKYYFMDNTVSGTFSAQDVIDGINKVTVEVREGDLKLYADNADTLSFTTTSVINDAGETVDQYYVDLAYPDTEENSIETFITYYDENGILITKEEWTRSEQFMVDKDSNLAKKYVRLDNIEYRTPRLYFKLAGVGKGVRLGSIVEVNLLTTNGSIGEMTDLPSTDVADSTVLSYTLVTEGTDEESSASIKDNAPLFHNSANRCIVKSDYVSFCNRQSSVKTSEVWGGEDERVEIPGHIWFSFLPSTQSRSFTSNVTKTLFSLDNPEDTVNWYIEDEEIESTTYDINGDLINPGVWNVIDEYRVPTLQFHNRNPMYMDFEFDINIMKYSIQTSVEDTHQAIFDVINDYFGTATEDFTNAETFWFEYFHSSLEKRIDIDLTDITGFNNTLTSKVMIDSESLIQENANIDNYDVLVPLAAPFEKMFENNGDLITSNLPDVSTLLFDGTNDLTVDWTAELADDSVLDSEKELLTADININGNVSGKYYIINDRRRYILIHLFAKDGAGSSDGVYATSQLDITDFDTARYLDVKYLTPNFSMYKNVIPRLRSVSFS